ncbi:MAG: nickel pincer cofactor biosynthesis protein LarB [Kiritimatiellaeota bacterium]|nr:nickel pincer cofactor biosynthesis protein LarB [Kiritimatiellota bacterium]
MMNDNPQINEIISGLRNGATTPEKAADILSELKRTASFADLDHGRAVRCGFPEFIYGEGKTSEQTLAISAEIASSGKPLLATRLSAESAKPLLEKFPSGDYDEISRTFLMMPENSDDPKGEVVIATAGTTDLPVAREAERTLTACGCGAKLIPDAGVAGIHRLFKSLPALESADAVIVVAGMEGALPSVVGGLIPCPVIAVPTSVGYGASLGGLTAMFSMLNSCANGITVVNIDNGFGAGCAAARIVNAIHA